jgi:hypothetical protein
MAGKPITVEQVRAREIEVGQTVWCDNDGDWLKVARIRKDTFGDWVLERRDRSMTEYRPDQKVLRLLDPPVTGEGE